MSKLSSVLVNRPCKTLDPTSMLRHSLLIQHHHLPTQQPPQLITYHLPPFRRITAASRAPRSVRASACTSGLLTRGTGFLLCLRGGGRRFSGVKFALADVGSGETVLFVDGVDGALEAAEEGLGAEEGGREVDCVGELVY